MTNKEIQQFLKEKDFFTGSKHFTKEDCEKFVAEFEEYKYLWLSGRMCGKQLIADSLLRAMAYLRELKKDGVVDDKK